MSAKGTKRRSARQVAERKQSRSIYYEPSSDEDEVASDDGDHAAELEEPAPKRRKTRPTRPTTRAAAQNKRETHKPRRTKNKVQDRKKQSSSRKLGAPLKPKIKKEPKYTGPSDNRIPDWTSLPIDILRDVFTFALNSTHDQTTSTSADVSWLMQAARTCRAFSVPALEAYYQAPKLRTTYQPHYLLELLQMPQEKTYVNYAVKVKSLEIPVNQIAYSAAGKERLNLSSLVTHPQDSPPYRLHKAQRWEYPKDMFQALDESGVRLKSWRWTSSMIPAAEVLDANRYIGKVYSRKAFEYVENLALCGFQDYDDKVSDVPDGRPIPQADEEKKTPGLATALSLLPHLKALTFVSCDCIMNDFLEHLPHGIERLHFNNCLELTSTMLKDYFKVSGSQLRELVINHCASVDLTFLPPLKALCPKLEVLKMDLTYYSERTNYNDAWAMYDHLLSDDDVPTWPSTLRHLELVNLKKWEAEAAQNLFRSLVEGAKDLPALRYLVLHAHISIPWRDRAQFRDQWIDRLNTVYLRRSEEPNQFLGSLRQYKLYKDAVADGRAVASPIDLDTDGESTTSRRLSHVRITPRKALADPETFEQTSPTAERPQRTARRSARVATRAESLNASTAGDDDESSSEADNESDDWSKQPEVFIQGLCNVVDIRIDNQRPAENQFTEANFLDSELSGDEDWHSGAEDEDEGYAW
ncbi:uncharacterized protein LTR77_002658 [Saxophila tyrrhenica]|uniref:F-box protein n=1 Tax=Saxophila tyrrhenica TaxID=1690608 RepID=A0AAV9PJL4_9PEZI|nr:hypothetical protein LTR77_002658 [Saxophila tyrrhenica]